MPFILLAVLILRRLPWRLAQELRLRTALRASQLCLSDVSAIRHWKSTRSFHAYRALRTHVAQVAHRRVGPLLQERAAGPTGAPFLRSHFAEDFAPDHWGETGG